MEYFSDFVRANPGLETYLVEHADSMFLLTGTKGEIYWANRSFLNWIGYSLIEFTRKHNPVTWIQFTVPDENLEADIQQARLCESGELNSYRVRKDYIPKNQHAKLVEINVRRYPETGPFKFFVVEVEPLFNGHERMARTYEKLAGELNKSLKAVRTEQLSIVEFIGSVQKMAEVQEEMVKAQKEMVQEQKLNRSSGLNGAFFWLVDHPKVGIPVGLFFAAILFGDRVLEIIDRFWK